MKAYRYFCRAALVCLAIFTFSSSAGSGPLMADQAILASGAAEDVRTVSIVLGSGSLLTSGMISIPAGYETLVARFFYSSTAPGTSPLKVSMGNIILNLSPGESSKEIAFEHRQGVVPVSVFTAEGAEYTLTIEIECAHLPKTLAG